MSGFKDTLEHINEYFKKEGIPAKAVKVEEEARTPEALVLFSADREVAANKIEKFEDITLLDGVTVITVEPAVEPGAAIVVATEEGVIPAPVNTEYELADGRVIVVGDTEGMISEVREAAAEVEEEGTPAVEEDMGGANEKIKRLIERVEKVKEFSTEKEAELKKENDFLHGEIAALKDVNLEQNKELVEFKEVVHNTFKVLLGEPEKKPAVSNKNPLAKEEKVNMFHQTGTPKQDK